VISDRVEVVLGHNICVIGSGYVGTVVAASLALVGHDVTAVEVDRDPRSAKAGPLSSSPVSTRCWELRWVRGGSRSPMTWPGLKYEGIGRAGHAEWASNGTS